MPEESITASTTPTSTTQETTPVTNSVTTAVDTSTASASDSKAVDPKTLTSEQMKDLIQNPPSKTEEKKPEDSKEEVWFDKEHGFKTAEDMKKSYAEAQNAIRERSEKLKELEQFRAQAEVQLQELAKKAENVPLSPEETQRKQAIESWKSENKDSLDFIKNLVKEDLKKEQVKETIENSALAERNQWKQEFDKDEARKTLWPKMEEIYAKKGDLIFQEMINNPFPYLEAVAFKENFSSIAQKIKQEAIESYKQEMKQAAEVAKAKSTATPGGLKSISSGVDVSKMSSADLGAMLPRGE